MLAWLGTLLGLGAHADECRLRVATFNVSLSRASAGELVAELSSGESEPARRIAEILQRVRPDVVLLNEFDHDADGEALRLFRVRFLARSQNGAEPIEYPFTFAGPVNTGRASGFDLDGDGLVGGPGDALGFGAFEGQFGMAILSRYEIDLARVRTFRRFLWRDLPGASLPDDPLSLEPGDWYSPEELDVLPLSSKSHWDVPVRIGDEVLHVLASHPTPPVFDGPEDRNGARNHDEIAFWRIYLTPDVATGIVDDRGEAGGLPEGAPFVIVGDLNADPLDGDSRPGTLQQLLEHARVSDEVVPRSRGAVEAALEQGGANASHRSPARFDTADFDDRSPGNLRVDHVLASSDLHVANAGVFWPLAGDPDRELVSASDHRLVWIDLSRPLLRGDDPLPVASGDSTQTSAVISADASVAGDVQFVVEEELDPGRIVTRETVRVLDPTEPAHAILRGLRPGVAHVFRATDAAGRVGVGRFRTLRSLESSGRVRIGVTGDSRGELGPFAALANVVSRELDHFVFLGDTIYADVASPRVSVGQARTLAELRAKHREVLSGRFGRSWLASLRADMASFATIDDHEITDDFAGGASPASDPRFSSDLAEWIHDTELFRNGLLAFLEAYPAERLLQEATGDPRTDGKPRLYRYRTLGPEAAMFLLDSRTFRDQALVDVDDPTDPDQASAFLAASFAPDRTMLGRAQLDELKRDLLDAESRGVVWKLVFVPEPIQNLGLIFAADRYEGYAAERAELLGFIRDRGIHDVVFVAADIHGTLVNNLVYQESPDGEQLPVDAFELTTGPIAYEPALGPSIIETAVERGVLPAASLAFYESLSRDEKDELITELIDVLVVGLGYDPLGLDGWDRGAELELGQWTAAHVWGWTEIEISPGSLDLKVTVWGVDPWDEITIERSPCEVLTRFPERVSVYRVPSRAASLTRAFVRGDIDGDARISIGDAVALFRALFAGDAEPLRCLDAADADDSGRLEITDGISILGYLFLGAARPAEPFPACGADPVPDGMDCTSHPPCARS